MKLNFTNKKERKNCQAFIKALKEIEKHSLKDSQRTVFIHAAAAHLQLAPSLLDLHRARLDATCLITLRPDTYSLQLDLPTARVFRLRAFKLLRCFKKIESRVAVVELSWDGEGMRVEFEVEGQALQGQLQLEAEEVEEPWPESTSSCESIYETVEVCRLGEEELRGLSMSEEEELWVEFGQSGLFLRTVLQGKYRKEDKILFKEGTPYSYPALRAKLRNRLFLNVAGDFFLGHLHEALKKKKPVELRLRNVYDRYVENQLQGTYLLVESQMDYGTLLTAVGGFLSDQMGSAGEEAVRRDYAQEREGQQSYLLKAEEGTDLKKIVFNRFNEVDAEAIIAGDAYRERRPMGKIEEGEETFTRRFQSRH
jgi:hypothetical protein